MDIEADAVPAARAEAPVVERIYRHRRPVRVMHWINVLCLCPADEWPADLQRTSGAVLGQPLRSARSVLSMRAGTDAERPAAPRASAAIAFDTTGVLGALEGRRRATRGASRLGHDSRPPVAGHGAPLALLLRLAVRDQRRRLRRLVVCQPATLRAIWCRPATTGAASAAPIVDHLRFQHPEGEAAIRYNVLQKPRLPGVIFVLRRRHRLDGAGHVATAGRRA